jgi:hypothetical protein
MTTAATTYGGTVSSCARAFAERHDVLKLWVKALTGGRRTKPKCGDDGG